MIYHPPYSPAARVTNAQFVKDLANFLPDVLVKYNDILMLRDFNLHLDEPDATLFTDVLDAMGLIPYVNFPTRVAGHTLDQVYTVVNSRTTVRNCRQSTLMSDHYVVNGHVVISHNPTIIKTVKSRKLKNIDIDMFMRDINMDDIAWSDIYDAVRALDTELLRVLDKHDDHIKEQLKVKRNREFIWNK